MCPEVPGANGQGETTAVVKASLVEAIEMILSDRLELSRSLTSRRSSGCLPTWSTGPSGGSCENAGLT